MTLCPHFEPFSFREARQGERPKRAGACREEQFTEEQVVFALKQTELGTRVEEVCRALGISDATFYVWMHRYEGGVASERRRLRQLDEQQPQAKAMLQAVVAKRHRSICPSPDARTKVF